MKNDIIIQLKKRIKLLLILFIVFLILSGLTAFPLEWELSILVNATQHSPEFLRQWFLTVYEALKYTNTHYPFISYGSDWLGFSHIVIAVAFYGPLKDPIKNSWILEFGMIACILIFPTAFICSYIRHIPLYWTFIDCSFGVIGFIPLYYCRKLILQLETLSQNK
jgi:hypothetical protein